MKRFLPSIPIWQAILRVKPGKKQKKTQRLPCSWNLEPWVDDYQMVENQ
jgi:hypothetical protein